jgi:hypothetical protein
LGLIPALKINDFNLGDQKNYVMLALHRYLMNMTRKNPNIVPHPWIKDITRSTILNVMKISHFGRHKEVNTCVKCLLSCYHGGYLWLDRNMTVCRDETKEEIQSYYKLTDEDMKEITKE